MEVTRRVARELVAEGLAEILQRGKVVDPHKFKGEGSGSSSPPRSHIVLLISVLTPTILVRSYQVANEGPLLKGGRATPPRKRPES